MGKTYQFSSDDDVWQINLTRSSISLTTTGYETWEKFRERLVGPLSALRDVYGPASYSRIGLRYVDVIMPSELGLAEVDWTELLQPHILGPAASRGVGAAVYAFESVSEIRLEDGRSVVRLISRMVEAKHDTEEQCYMVDSDFFNNDRTPLEEAMDKLDYLGERGSRLFRWCITKRLYKAMEPESL